MTDEDQAGPREPGSRGAELVLAATFLLGVVTSLVLVLTWGLLTGDDEPRAAQAGLAQGTDLLDQGQGPSPGATGDPGASSPAPVATRPAPSRLARCASAEHTLAQALDAAGPALEQWKVHVDAMNQLVVGEITLQQATDFWNRTRVGAQHKVAGFRDTVQQVRRDGVDCPDPDLLAPGSRRLPGCARQVQAEIAVLRAARTSIDTWDRHITDMDMLRMGDLSPDEATRMWLSMWHQGVRDLEAYRTAQRHAEALDGCAGIATP
ncbi:hypothetical protein ASG76_02410 [Nocardioides sp. Soil774]|nr:hypothetical protein ASG76_02410 [Nocardioides sp. Soil774]